MAIPKHILDKLLKNAFLKTFKVGGLYRPTEDIFNPEIDWRSSPMFYKHKLYVLTDSNPSYDYGHYCKMCAYPDDTQLCELLHYHLDFLDVSTLKIIQTSIYCGLPKTTSEWSMYDKIVDRLKTSRFRFALVEE